MDTLKREEKLKLLSKEDLDLVAALVDKREKMQSAKAADEDYFFYDMGAGWKFRCRILDKTPQISIEMLNPKSEVAWKGTLDFVDE
jgi:hypothetical protein